MTSLNRITFHWTGGTNIPNETDLKAYHFLVDDKGAIYSGKYKPEDNIDCKDGVYARHCGGCNTGNIGIALCGMFHPEKYPIRRLQLERACRLAAELCEKYGIRITNRTVMTHAEVGRMLPNSSSYGKVDIDKLPCVAVYGVTAVGNWLRNKVQWYKERLK